MGIQLPDGLGSLSWSKVSAYEGCPACFEKQYILRLECPVDAHLALGSGVHAAVQAARQALIAHTPIVTAECMEAGIKVVRQELGQRDKEVDLHKFEDVNAVEARLRLVAEVALRDIVGRDEAGSQVLLDVERSIQYQKVFDFPFNGKFDAVVGVRKPGIEKPLLYMVKDLKTASRDSAGVSSTNLQQLATYIMPFAQEGKGIPWAVIERVTTTQNPVAAVFGYRPTAEELATVKAKIERVAAEIASGRFPEIPGIFCQFSHKLPSVASFQKTLTPEAPKKPRGKGKAGQTEEAEVEAAA